MPLIRPTEMLADARHRGYAVCALNVENMEMVKAVVQAAESLRAPVIVQLTPSTLRYVGARMAAAMVRAEAERASAPIALHVDHGSSLSLLEEAISAGFTSVMIDGSMLALPENIALARQAVTAASRGGIPVEAELGRVGGKEDDLEAEGDALTDPQEAVRFVQETGVQSLAVAIGTAHGVYQGTPRIDVDRLRAIAAVVPLPLVLHGASGLEDAVVQACIGAGIAKVNFATELRIAFTGGVRAALSAQPDLIDPKVLGCEGMARVAAVAQEKIRVCGAAGRA